MRSTPRKIHWLVALSTFAALGATSLHASNNPADRARLSALGGNRPLAFEENRGQTDPRVKYLARNDGSTLFLTPSEAVLALRGSALRIRWADGATAPRITAEGQLPGVTNYLTGKDPSRWRTGVRSWTRIHYDEVWPGIDLVFYGNPKQLEYDVVVAPGAEPGRVRLAFDGAEELRIDPAGDLVARVGGEEVRLRRPVSYQEVEGVRRDVGSSWRLLPGTREAGFQVGAYDRSRPLVIDPVIVYSTYLGGGHWEEGRDIVTDPAGNAYVAGLTFSANFPTAGAPLPLSGYADAFIAKFDPEGQLVFSTLLGGSGGETAEAIGVIPYQGDILLAGDTSSADFPLVRPVQPALGGSSDAFVARLAADGSTLLFSSYLGGRGTEFGLDIAFSAEGMVVVGTTRSVDFPVTLPLSSLRGGSDGFIAAIDSSGLACSAYFGGSRDDEATGVAVGPGGSLHVVGITSSPDLRVLNAFQERLSGGQDAFVAQLFQCGRVLQILSYLGGSQTDQPYAVAVDAAGGIHIAGATSSSDFPVASPIQGTFGGVRDAFVTKLRRNGDLERSTYLGGSSWDEAWDLALAPGGEAVVAGPTRSFDFPVVQAVQAHCAPEESPGTCSIDGFVTRLNAAGAIEWSTYLGGTEWSPAYGPDDAVVGVATDPRGDVYATGWTYSMDFPTVRAFQPDLAPIQDGENDAFVTKIASRVNRPPDCSAAAAAPSLLWPPNGKLVPVRIGGATDPDGDPVTISVTAIRQDEPIAQKGQPAPDATGLGTSRPLLRASRSGNGDGRVYHITFTATDSAGAACAGTVTVCVPHDQGKRTCGDGGPLFASIP